MSNQIDSTLYTQLPLFSVAGGQALATALRTALPKELHAPLKKQLADLKTAADSLRDAWAEEQGVSLSDKRPADQAIDRAWAALYERLHAYSTMPVEHYPEAERASELLAHLFPDGLTFLKLPYALEWAESDKRLHQIETGGLTKTIHEVAGPAFLGQVQRTHGVYGAVLGITEPSSVQTPLRAERIAELRRVMSKYVMALLVQLDENDPDSVMRVQKALQPIDEFRASAASRQGAGGGADSTDATDGGAVGDGHGSVPALTPTPVTPASVTPAPAPVASGLAVATAPAPAPVPSPVVATPAPTPSVNPS